jgi:L-ascorbate metabolism protein UlaG (beta-lactamase superfamily)
MQRFAKGLAAAALIVGASGLVACLPLARRPLVDSYEPLEADGAPAPSSGLRARFLGTSTIVLTDGETTIMTDGFLSRPSLGRLALLPVTPNRVRIEHALLKARATRVAAIFVAQSHHDHAMDTPYVAQLTGATIVGSESTRNIALGVGFRGKTETLGHGSRHSFGRFRVTAYKTPHSSPKPFPGKIDEKLSRRAWIEDYREGGNFSFFIEHDLGRVLIVPSRGCWTGQFKGLRADVVFLGIGGLFTRKSLMRDYWEETVVRRGASKVIPIHWDNFFRPLDRKLKPLFGGSFNRRMEILEELAGGKVDLVLPRAWEEIPLDVKPRDPNQPPPRSETGPPRPCGSR